MTILLRIRGSSNPNATLAYTDTEEEIARLDLANLYEADCINFASQSGLGLSSLLYLERVASVPNYRSRT